MNIENILIVVLINFLMVTSATRETGKSIISSSDRLKVLTVRRKRTLLLPKNGSVKLTVGLGQALIANSPKGFSLSLEISDYYTGLTTFKDWLNEAPHRNVNKPNVKMSNKQSNSQNYIINTNDKTKNNMNSASLHPMGYVKNALDMKMSSLTKPYKYYNQYPWIVKHSQLNKNNLMSEWIDHSSQPNHKRSIEGILSGLLGTNFKCILFKSICLSEQFMLPRGYSMIHDIIRIMFLTPVRIASGEVESSLCEERTICDMDLKSSHSFNILDWILHPMNVNKI